ncbi:hypothetical protein CIK05_04610 [Bdellovibrio sp. qaytius]|nr:hypothetical protein CIK05_04610 [Bdellovibrio sp. qaytius]
MEQILIRANTPSDEQQTGTLHVRRFLKIEIVKNILIKLLIFWGLAFVTFFIPVYDVFLTPLFFVIGLYQALDAEKARFKIHHGQVACPHCKENIKFKRGILYEDHEVVCQKCTTVVKIALKDPYPERDGRKILT